MKPSLIVSFTSYPARIRVVSQVLESLYAQSMKPDRILLWLAEEQFPNHESDLPKELIDDAAAGKFELRWCDDLGSHKKYFYSMQEFPDDIIITVDDDNIYHPDLLKVLYESYLRYPKAVSAMIVSLILFDENNNPRPITEWLYDFRQLHVPSMQLFATGAAGILYPPGCLDKRAFDKTTIRNILSIGNTFTSDDGWLKANQALVGTPVVLASDRIMKRVIPNTQEESLHVLHNKSSGNFHSRGKFYLIRRHFCVDGRDELFEKMRSALNDPNYIPESAELWFDYALKDMEQKIYIMEHDDWGDAVKRVLPEYIRRTISGFNRQMSRENDKHAEEKYVSRLREILSSVEGIDVMAESDITLRALVEYGAVLRKRMFGQFRKADDYRQMLSNWESFFHKHPDCDPVYHTAYESFKKDMEAWLWLFINYRLAICNELLARGGVDKVQNNIKTLQKMLRLTPEIQLWADRSQEVEIRAVCDYGAVLKTNLWGDFRHAKDYLQMAQNWREFLVAHPRCDERYFDGYERFFKDMNGAIAEMEQNGASAEELAKCQSVLEADWALWHRPESKYIRLKKWFYNSRYGHVLSKVKRKIIQMWNQDAQI